jgi:opacity protein-like surface antigen
MRNIAIHLLLLLIVDSSALLAEDFRRFEFQPFGGFTGSGGIPLIADDDVRHGSIRVNSSSNFGATLAVNLNALDAVEAHWQRRFTEGRLPAEIPIPLSPGNSTSFSPKIDRFHCNFLHHYRIADPRAMPYVMAGLGVTTYGVAGNGQSDSESHFSFALGGGVKYFITSRFGLRGEARWSPTVWSSSGSTLWCSVGGGATCLIDLKTSVQHQLDLTGGLVFRF